MPGHKVWLNGTVFDDFFHLPAGAVCGRLSRTFFEGDIFMGEIRKADGRRTPAWRNFLWVVFHAPENSLEGLSEVSVELSSLLACCRFSVTF